MLRISTSKLVTYNTGFKTSFQDGFIAASKLAQVDRIATIVPSDTLIEEYGWLHDIPQIREWIGERQINALVADGYQIRNKDYELTIGVKANDLNDDRVGLYAPRFRMMGDEVARFPTRLAMGALKNGFTTKCFDGQFFFDTDHPYTKADGTTDVQSNSGGGAGTPWYLLSTQGPLKPIIYQNRQDFAFVALDRPEDPNVFMKKELLYGVDGRANVGYGFWQMAVGSQQTLDATGFKAARQLMTNLLGDGGKPLGLMPDTLVIPPSLQDNAEATLLVQRLADGGDNPLYKAVDIVVSPYLI
jgi:phage major head subunit gpT-like protein